MADLESILDSVPRIAKVTQFCPDSLGKLIPDEIDNLPVRVALEAYLGARLLAWSLYRLAEKAGEGPYSLARRIAGFSTHAIPSAAMLYFAIDLLGAYEFGRNEAWDCWGIAVAYFGGHQQICRKKAQIKTLHEAIGSSLTCSAI